MEKPLDQVIFTSETMQAVYKDIVPYIESAATVLFWGETGSGMGFLAKAIHEASGRPGKFLTIPGFSLDDETVKQQFLGVEHRPGWLEEAHNGTIFIKRISETTLPVQRTIQHLLTNRSVDGRLPFTRKGGTKTLSVNVRFIFSMAHDLNLALQDELVQRDAIEEIKRRGGRIIQIPALRDRKEDIIQITQNFITTFNQQYNGKIIGVTVSAQEILEHYIWPGNVEELKQVIENIYTQHPGITEIDKEHLPDHIINPEITGDKYRFKFKDDAKFLGKILSPLLLVQTENKKLRLNTGDLHEIIRIEDKSFAPPKFRHFIFRLKDGSQIVGKILDKKMNIDTSFDHTYQINPQEISSVYLA